MKLVNTNEQYIIYMINFLLWPVLTPSFHSFPHSLKMLCVCGPGCDSIVALSREGHADTVNLLLQEEDVEVIVTVDAVFLNES